MVIQASCTYLFVVIVVVVVVVVVIIIIIIITYLLSRICNVLTTPPKALFFLTTTLYSTRYEACMSTSCWQPFEQLFILRATFWEAFSFFLLRPHLAPRSARRSLGPLAARITNTGDRITPEMTTGDACGGG